jgi:hypothetical protein
VALTQAMLEGKLAVRADVAKHQGDFKKSSKASTWRWTTSSSP